jgi:hypothetical protein
MWGVIWRLLSQLSPAIGSPAHTWLQNIALEGKWRQQFFGPLKGLIGSCGREYGSDLGIGLEPDNFQFNDNAPNFRPLTLYCCSGKNLDSPESQQNLV